MSGAEVLWVFGAVLVATTLGILVIVSGDKGGAGSSSQPSRVTVTPSTQQSPDACTELGVGARLVKMVNLKDIAVSGAKLTPKGAPEEGVPDEFLRPSVKFTVINNVEAQCLTSVTSRMDAQTYDGNPSSSVVKQVFEEKALSPRESKELGWFFRCGSESEENHDDACSDAAFISSIRATEAWGFAVNGSKGPAATRRRPDNQLSSTGWGSRPGAGAWDSTLRRQQIH